MGLPQSSGVHPFWPEDDLGLMGRSLLHVYAQNPTMGWIWAKDTNPIILPIYVIYIYVECERI